MNMFFLGLAVLFAIVDWWAVAASRRRVEWIAKPAVLISLIVFSGLAALSIKQGIYDFGGLELGILPFIAGLFSSLIGDVLLMQPRERFGAGVTAFMLAHIAYIIGFNPVPPAKIQHIVVAGLVILLVALPAAQINRRVTVALDAGKNPKTRSLIGLCSIIASLMFVSALFTMLRGGWQPFAAVAAVAGAAFFLLSDVLLAWNRFVAPQQYNRLTYTIPYHLGQILITVGAVMQYLTNPA